MKIAWLSTIVCLLQSSWTVLVNGGGREKFCSENQCRKPRIDLSVTFTGGSVEFQWTSPISPLFGFCIFYECNSDVDVNYCSDGREKCIHRDSKSGRRTYSYTNLKIPHNATTCWFWMATKGTKNYCSEVVHSNISSPTEVSQGPSSTIMLPSTIDNLLPSTSTVAPMITSSTTKSLVITSSTSASLTSSIITSSQSLSTASSQLPPTTVQPTSTAVSSSSSTTLPSSPSSTTLPPSSSSTTLPSSPSSTTLPSSSTILPSSSTTLPLSSSTTLPSVLSTSTPSKSSIPPSESFSSYKRKISTHLMVLLAFLSVAVLAVLLMSIMLLVYWKKNKLRQFDDLTKNKIEEYCDYNDEVAKDNNSDLEYVEPDDKDYDAYTIHEDNLYMLEQISHKQEEMIRRTSIDSHCSDDSEVDSGVPSHYYGSNNGSAGHCSSLNNITIDCGNPASSDDDSI